ncbi:hypothetical protein [Bifidobacterium sp. UTBIF-56]|uniref:hypothetical protein n=1 Tax=Bifidobacterium sp. UTBIF-56 TaxID=1465261 RepID=UPI00215970A5|nr:hypothetical protein [Bifidobacterium sp. UTBIF-56]
MTVAVTDLMQLLDAEIEATCHKRYDDNDRDDCSNGPIMTPTPTLAHLTARFRRLRRFPRGRRSGSMFNPLRVFIKEIMNAV